MAYTASTFVADEQPTTSKWNLLWANDASFNDGTGFANDIIKSKHLDWAATGGGDSGGIWWEELGRTILGSAADTISVAISARKYLRIEATVANSGVITPVIRFNSDSGTNYALRYTNNNTTGGSVTSLDYIGSLANSANPARINAEVSNISSTQKFVHALGVSGSTSAGTAPEYFEIYGKWVNTSSQITTVSLVNIGAGDFATGTELIVRGHD